MGDNWQGRAKMITLDNATYAQLAPSPQQFGEISIADHWYYSMAAWVRPAVTAPCMTSGDPGYIWSEGTRTGSADPDTATSLYISNGRLAASFRTTGAPVTTVGGTAQTQLTAGEWSFVAMGRDAYQCWVSVNGGPKVVRLLAFPPEHPDTWGLGALFADGPQHVGNFAGDLAYVTGWRSYVLTDADLTALYNSGQPDAAPFKTRPAQPRWLYFCNDEWPHYGFMNFSVQGDAQFTPNSVAIAGAGDRPFDPAIVTRRSGLRAFWSFQEATGEPRVSSDGLTVLYQPSDSGPVERVGDGLFGPFAARFNVDWAAYLQADRADIPYLLFQGNDPFTMVAWLKPHDTRKGFIAGVWDEERRPFAGELLAGRQYAMFKGISISPNSPPPNTVVCHISYDGQGTPPSPFNTDYSAGAQLVVYKPHQCAAVTWDGVSARSYLDGYFLPRPPGPHPSNDIWRNPYTPAHPGLFEGTDANFTVGRNHIAGGMFNDFRGVIYGLAIYDRALSDDELQSLSDGVLACGPQTCNDNNACTIDTCTDGTGSNGAPLATCTHEPVACPGLCDPASGACVDCLADSDCADGEYCNGTEACVGHLCTPGSAPCSNAESCNEALDMCEPLTSPSMIDGVDIPEQLGANALLATQNALPMLGDNLAELDQMFIRSAGTRLYLGITGNVADEGAAVAVLFDVCSGGQNRLQFGLATAAAPLSDMLLDEGFAPDYMLYARARNGHLDVYIYQLGENQEAEERYVGRGTIDSHNPVLAGGANAYGMEAALDNGNTAGVTDVSTNDAGTATRGLEMSIEMADLGLGGHGLVGTMAVLTQSEGRPTNQFLPGVRDQFVPGEDAVDLQAVAGWQFADFSLLAMDANGDGIVNGDDYAMFAACALETSVAAGTPVCRVFDMVRDDRVDLADFAVLQRLITTDAR
jgi:hypothetical protein